MIVQKILNTAEKFPEKEAIVTDRRRYSYGELATEIRTRAFAYQHVPYKKVVLAHTDSLENLLDLLACMAVGKASVMASTRLAAEEIETLRIQEKATVLTPHVCPPGQLDAIRRPGMHERFLGVLTPGLIAPKVIWKDYQSWVSAFPYQSEVFGITAEDRLLVVDALGYSANLNSVLHLLWQGGTVVMTSLKSAKHWVQQLKTEAITSVFMVPSHYRLWAGHTEPLSQICSLVTAGEKLDPVLTSALLQACPKALLTEYYGVHELGHISYQQNEEILQHGYAVGRAFPGVKISITNQRIGVESPYVSPDYRSVNTVFDLGLIEDGRLILTGRAGKLFQQRVLSVYAEELENRVKVIETVFTEFSILCIPITEDQPFQKQMGGIQERNQHLLLTLPPTKCFRRPSRNLPRKDREKMGHHATIRLCADEDSASYLL